MRGLRIAAGAALALAACGDDAPAGAPTPPPPPPWCEGAVFALSDPAGPFVVFPSNFHTEDDASTPGGIRLRYRDRVHGREPTFARYPGLAEDLEALDGFSTQGAVTVRLSAPFEAAALSVSPEGSVAATSPVRLVVVDRRSEAFGEVVPVEVDLRWLSERLLFATPLFPLRPKTTYALAVRSVSSDADGCLAPDPSLRALLSGTASGPGWDRLAPDVPAALEALAADGFAPGPEALAFLTLFTTQSILEDYRALLDAVAEADAARPLAVVPGSVRVVSEGTCPVGPRLEGALDVPALQDEEGRIHVEGGRAVLGTRPAPLPFDLTLPCGDGPFPVAIFQHGLNGDRHNGRSRQLAPLGVAVVSIDAPQHGDRNTGGNLEALDFFALDVGAEKPFDMLEARDNFRAAYVELAMVSRLASRGLDLLPAEAPDGEPELSGRVLYLGHSLGGILGAGLLALDPHVEAAALSAGGAGLTRVMLDSEGFSLFLNALVPEGTSPAEVQAFFPFLQALFEKGDPGNLAPHVLAPLGPPFREAAPHLLFQAVEQDGIVPNSTNELLARALGLPHLPPVLHEVPYLAVGGALPLSGNGPGGATVGYFQLDLQAEGETAVHGGFESSEASVAQWVPFFASHLERGTAELVDPYVELGLK